jgi:hypothetical protein
MPALTEIFEQNRVLIVLDNIESLVTETGSWRDDRWALLIDALTNHHGLSRFILTSRRRPAALPSMVLVEAVHALSLREAVLLAREWPHLRALIDVIDSRDLAARTLALVQGHPKLIELANGLATTPAVLAERLKEADNTWLAHGTKLDPFLHGAEPAATDDDYLAVLAGWTRATVAALPADSATLFHVLCCLEEGDRIRPVVEDNWANLWQRLGCQGSAPELDTALAPLVDQALVVVDSIRYLIHPGLAETTRTAAGLHTTDLIDTVLAEYWLDVLFYSQSREQVQHLGRAVRHAARAAAPYLVRQHRWTELTAAAEMALQRSNSTATTAAFLPMLTAAAEATRDTEVVLVIGSAYARAFARIDADQAEIVLRHLLASAVAQHRFSYASIIVADMIPLLSKSGRLDEAITLIDTAADYTDRAGVGRRWTMEINSLLKSLLFTTVYISTDSARGPREGTGFIYLTEPCGVPIPVAVTAKHIVKDARSGEIRAIRGMNGQPILGEDVVFAYDDFASRWTGHPDESVDVAAVPMLSELMQLDELPFFHPIDENYLPTQKQAEELDLLELVTFVGYPVGLYDTTNLTPIARQGVAATPIELDWQGKPSFLIDAAVVAGSSGSPDLCGQSRNSPESWQPHNRRNADLLHRDCLCGLPGIN